MRRAGRYNPEYRAVRKQYSLIEICEKPQLAAQVIIEAPEHFFPRRPQNNAENSLGSSLPCL
jgi:hypothetical protein